MKMKLELDLNKSLDKNAGVFFDKAKKIKKKIEGAEQALKISQEKLVKLKKKKIVKEQKKIERKKQGERIGRKK